MSELPTTAQLAEAKEALHTSERALQDISIKIERAEQQLAEIVASTKRTIDGLNAERAVVQEEIALVLAYVSPIRRLPNELLREVFLVYFEEDARCAWTLAAVCSLWRRITIAMPKIWSKVRLETTQNDSADTIRLWLERSGASCPLDIEITLQVLPPLSPTVKTRCRARSHSYAPLPSPPLSWTAVQVHQHGPVNIGTGGGVMQYIPPGVFPPPPVLVSPPHSHHGSPSPPSASSSTRSVAHWGHIAMYYLTQQMHRWERFVFKFDKSFPSIASLKSITGNAPLLKAFEISCSESGGFYFDNTWSWLPTQQTVLPSLQSLTLSNMPFKWSSPMLNGSGLTSICLRALPIATLSLDRLQHILTSNAMTLASLTLFFPTTQPAILPLTPLTLPALEELSFSGHHLLLTLLDNLILPSLESLNLTLDLSRHPDPLEETLSNLLIRSQRPSLTSLTLAHGANHMFYATPGPGPQVFMPWSFLNDIPALTHLTVSNSAVEPLLALLTGPDDEGGGGWLCPDLTSLTLRSCHPHADGVSKLVGFIDARNPAESIAGMSAASAVARIQSLELSDSLTVGVDVLEWLKSRVKEVSVIEPVYERCVFAFE
ncbi:hypothetical protein BU17DRAFT_82788 [Hysterangium stoloniferum]|nr:hypothetical protein BU17DRAFT_82788 [Hysterangium stoloniferum]